MPEPVTRAGLLDTLRTATQSAHDELEALETSRAILDHSLTPAGYRRVIEWQRLSLESLELQLSGVTWGEIYGYTSRLAALARESVDRREFESDPLGLPTGSGVGTPEAVGVAYVIEGSSLGGSVVYKHLNSSPHLGQFAPFPFYAFQREVGTRRWRKFVAYAKTLAFSPAETQRASQSANRAFGVFAKAWHVVQRED